MTEKEIDVTLKYDLETAEFNDDTFHLNTVYTT